MGFDIVGIEVAQYYLFRKVLASDRDTLFIAFRRLPAKELTNITAVRRPATAVTAFSLAPLPFKIFHLRSKSSSEGLRV